MQNWPRISIWLVTALCCVCTLLPWWSRNGLHITGFGGPALGNPGWLVLVFGGVVVLGQFLGGRIGNPVMRLAAAACLLFSAAHLWRAFRLEAIGIGLPLLVLLSLLNLVLVLRHLRAQPR